MKKSIIVLLLIAVLGTLAMTACKNDSSQGIMDDVSKGAETIMDELQSGADKLMN